MGDLCPSAMVLSSVHEFEPFSLQEYNYRANQISPVLNMTTPVRLVGTGSTLIFSRQQAAALSFLVALIIVLEASLPGFRIVSRN